MQFRTYTDDDLDIDETLDEKEIVKRIQAKLLEEHRKEHNYSFGEPKLEIVNDPTERKLGEIDLNEEIKQLPKEQFNNNQSNHSNQSYGGNSKLKPAHNILSCSCNCGKLLQARLGFISYDEVFSDSSDDDSYSSNKTAYQPSTLTFTQASNYDTSSQIGTYSTGGYL